jgi:hypothetical protein
MNSSAISLSEYFERLLLPLAQVYESGSLRGVQIKLFSVVDLISVRSYLEGICAVGWLTDCGESGYHLTPAGYREFRPRIQKLRDRRQHNLRRTLLKKVHRQKNGFWGTYSHPDTRIWRP